MLFHLSFSAKRKIVSWSQMPLPAIATLCDEETEILTVVIFVVGEIVEYHAAVHFLYFLCVLCKVAAPSRHFIVVILLLPHAPRVVGMSELN